MKIETIAVVDDDPRVRALLKESLEKKGLDVVLFEEGKKCLDHLKKKSVDLLLTDMKMPKMGGLELIRKVREESPHTLIVVVTAFGSIDNAVEAMRAGAHDYLIKPFSLNALDGILEKADTFYTLSQENHFFKKEMKKKSHSEVIAESPAMKEILALVAKVAPSHASVFIQGESGVGKEVIAGALHELSERSKKPFIRVNCAAMSETLIESEFFGHEKGAFTGAYERKPGRFELADGGTLLLDEISEIPLLLQAKLLRVTQGQEFERVGGTKSLKVDVRLISTSNRPIKEMLEQKILREDLFYRLNVIPILIPPLRERREDISPLAQYFLKRLSEENGLPLKKLSKEAMNKLLTFRWPGNVRELANVIERAVVTTERDEKVIQPTHLHLYPSDNKTIKESLTERKNMVK